MLQSVFLTTLIASAPLSGGAVAHAPEFELDLPSGDLFEALARLSARTGASIGTDRSLAGRVGMPVKGRMSVDEALRRMLAGSGLMARKVGPSSWRLVPIRVRDGEVVPSGEGPEIADIVVTARKRPERLSQIPGGAAVYRTPTASSGNDPRADAHAVASAVEGLSMTNRGPGSDRVFIRGIADSPFDGFSQATVSVVVNEARVTYDAPEPGLRLVDVDRVEVLKGPQGPLYGTGALGGVLRIVTNVPAIGTKIASSHSGGAITERGGASADASFILNAPLTRDTAALRLVGYVDAQDGWISDAGGGRSINGQTVVGGRSAVRIIPASHWSIDLDATGQWIKRRDSQYVDGPESLTRSPRVAEPSAASFGLASAVLEGWLGEKHLTIASSYAAQTTWDHYALSRTGSIPPITEPPSYNERRAYRVFDQEVRIASPPVAKAWLVGASYLSAATTATGATATKVPGAPIFLLRRVVTEAALFADISLTLSPRWRFGAGGRLFRATTDDELQGDHTVAAVAVRASTSFTPSTSLSYEPTAGQEVYLRLASAFRPGGVDPTKATTGRYEADEVRTIEIGTRWHLPARHLEFVADVFASSWANVQSDYLEANGLPATRSAGDASIMGFEVTSKYEKAGWLLTAGIEAQRARLIRAPSGSDLPSDPRLPVVPDITARLMTSRTFKMLSGKGTINAQLNYIGQSRLSFDPGLDRGMGNFTLVEVGFDLVWHDRHVQLRIDNLLDSRANMYAFGNPFLVRVERQYTPPRPRTFILSISIPVV